MKWLAIALVLANVAYYGWRYELRLRAAHTAPTAPAPLPATTPSLRLLSELDELPPLRAPESEPTVVTAGGVISAGPSAAPPIPELAPPRADAAPDSPTPINPPPASAPVPAEVATSASEPPPNAVPAVQRIQPSLLAPEPPSISARPVAGGGVASDHCVEIGPFPATKDADAIESWLTARATAMLRIVQVVRKRKFFWVYLEPHNADEAQAAVADLKRKGVHDYLLVQRGGLQNAISLGLFTTQEAVNRRLSEMSKQGYQPVVVPRIEVTEYEWLRANLSVGYTATDTLPREQLAGAAVQMIDCAKIADPTLSP